MTDMTIDEIVHELDRHGTISPGMAWILWDEIVRLRAKLAAVDAAV